MKSSLGSVKKYFDGFINNPIPVDEDDRKEIPLPKLKCNVFPAIPEGIKWCGILLWKPGENFYILLSRFGRRVTLKKGDRLELQNIKVVVEKPKSESDR